MPRRDLYARLASLEVEAEELDAATHEYQERQERQERRRKRNQKARAAAQTGKGASR